MSVEPDQETHLGAAIQRSVFDICLTGGCDWSAGVPACNVAFFSDVKLRRSQIVRAFSRFALMQAGTPAFQSVDVSTYFSKVLKINGNVPNVCPRCCGRNAKSTIFPFPYETSASAALPLRYFSPSIHPDRSASLSA